MQFTEIKPSDQSALAPYLEKLRFVDTGFTALYYVADELNVRYAFIGNTLAISYDFPTYTAYTLFGAEELSQAVEALEQNGRVRFICVPERELEAYRAVPGYAAEIVREGIYADYVCRYDDFISMKGQDHRRKCKDYNRFITRHDYAVREIAEENLSDVRALMNAWCEGRSCAECLCGCERNWVCKLLAAWGQLPARGLLVDVDGRPQGFDIAELCGDTMLRLVGKPVGRQEGLHVFMGVQTALRQFAEARYVNSGPDLGLGGLAVMKQKFKPYSLIDKYAVTLTKR